MSSNIAQWQQDLALLPDMEMSEWQPFLHSCSSQQLDRDQLVSALTALGNVSGWLQESGQTLTLRQQSIQPGNALLAGELFAGNDYWLITRLPRDRWQLHHHRLLPVAASEANSLGQATRQLLSGRQPGQLCYWKLWKADLEQENAPVCRIALLTAIEETGA